MHTQEASITEFSSKYMIKKQPSNFLIGHYNLVLICFLFFEVPYNTTDGSTLGRQICYKQNLWESLGNYQQAEFEQRVRIKLNMIWQNASIAKNLKAFQVIDTNGMKARDLINCGGVRKTLTKYICVFNWLSYVVSYLIKHQNYQNQTNRSTNVMAKRQKATPYFYSKPFSFKRLEMGERQEQRVRREMAVFECKTTSGHWEGPP